MFWVRGMSHRVKVTNHSLFLREHGSLRGKVGGNDWMSSLYFYQADVGPDLYNSYDKDNMKRQMLEANKWLNSDNSIDGIKVLEF